jgi:hypothetical protein
VGQNGAGHDADSRGHPPEEPLDGGLHLAKKKKIWFCLCYKPYKRTLQYPFCDIILNIHLHTAVFLIITNVQLI